ncbi:helix-turn-helix domain-containing protein [Paenibacillus sp. 2TAB26]|uniref:response regulator transcription factor n=1 Tax=Paenibacillus sp. 2TAB26 TaxID=3233005 RepID=UPI003F999278
MYRVMLVDDEAGVRNSIRAKIDWESAGFVIAYEASDGEEALRMLAEAVVRPDIVISDIRMPKMDGITFIRACKEAYPELRVIVLSGYSDFDYMKSAIQLGVKDYLLKPVVRAELSSLLGKLAGELKEERLLEGERQREKVQRNQQLRQMQEHFLLQLVKEEGVGESAVRDRLHHLQLAKLDGEALSLRFATLEMRLPPGRLRSWEGRRDLLQLAFRMLCRETADKREDVYPFYDVGHPSMMFFLLVDTGSKESGDAAAEQFVRELRRNAAMYLRLESVGGIGEPVSGWREAKNAYASCMLAWSRETIDGSATASTQQGVLDWAQSFTAETERRLIQAIETLNRQAFSAQLLELFPSNRDMPMFAFTFLALRVILTFGSLAKKFELGDTSLQQVLWNCQASIATYRSREEVLAQIERIADLVMDAVRSSRTSSGQLQTEAVRKYVDENYPYELTLSQLASMFHMNETYLSGLFKQNAGVTFSDYLTRLRMTRAAELLSGTDLKLTDIAMLVGYSSSSYFSTSFKKYYGCSPKEYREKRQTTNES